MQDNRGAKATPMVQIDGMWLRKPIPVKPGALPHWKHLAGYTPCAMPNCEGCQGRMLTFQAVLMLTSMEGRLEGRTIDPVEMYDRLIRYTFANPDGTPLGDHLWATDMEVPLADANPASHYARREADDRVAKLIDHLRAQGFAVEIRADGSMDIRPGADTGPLRAEHLPDGTYIDVSYVSPATGKRRKTRLWGTGRVGEGAGDDPAIESGRLDAIGEGGPRLGENAVLLRDSIEFSIRGLGRFVGLLTAADDISADVLEALEYGSMALTFVKKAALYAARAYADDRDANPDPAADE